MILFQKGACQYIRVNVKKDLSGNLVLGDNSYPKIPYIGFANVRASIIGSLGTSVYLNFQVGNNGLAHSILLPSNPSGGLVSYANPPTVIPAPTFVPAMVGSSGFTINITDTTSQKYCATIEITIIES